MEIKILHSKTVETALEMLKDTSWDALTMEALAAKMSLTPIQLYTLFPTRCDLLKGIVQLLDEKMISLYQEGKESLSLHEKLFDIIMCRFEALESYKKALKNIFLTVWRDPISFPSGIFSGFHSMRLILETVGVPVEGIKGGLNIKILSFFYLYTLKIWFEDETQDMAKTLAQVDQGLKNIIDFINV
ncbi:MAG: hypothetical protein BGO77_05425 [Caedibacter sp. 37-49]|nr:MAG: hypothetical protein BGO77_05425 [Caedibacter sp. 37-49]